MQGRPVQIRLRLAAIAMAALLPAACGQPSAVSLRSLAADSAAHDGEQVAVVGTVAEVTEADGATERHLLLQDDAQHRVQLVPLEAAEPHIGANVRVTGRYTFDPDRGRRLEIEEISEAPQG